VHRVIGGLKHLDMHWDDNWFLGPAFTGTGTITLDPTFGSFTLFESVFILDEPNFLVKVLRLEWIFFGVQSVDVQHLIYWQGLHVCDALFLCITTHPRKIIG
jgi:hypothetical protein